MLVREKVTLPAQVQRFPPTRYMGSKSAILDSIWSVASQFSHDSVLDLFSGTGVVSYMFKAQGKQVTSNDYMAFSYDNTTAVVANSEVTLSTEDVRQLCEPNTENDGFVSQTFAGLYFSDEDNAFIDRVRGNLKRFDDGWKRVMARAALERACIKKRPRGIFTYTGHRYDDGRRDLQLSLEEHFRAAVELLNAAVFDNGKKNHSRRGDALTVQTSADLVYLDPPYYSPLSDNEYVRRYHFVEGLARDWQGVEIQEHTRTKKFKSYPTPFSRLDTATDAFDQLFRRHSDSVIMVSYSSNALPDKDTILKLLNTYKQYADIVSVDHRYHFGNQGHLASRPNNKVQEYLFVGHD